MCVRKYIGVRGVTLCDDVPTPILMGALIAFRVTHRLARGEKVLNQRVEVPHCL